MRLLRCVLLLCVVGGVLQAQDNPDWYLNEPIREIRFEGLRTVTENELFPVIESFIDEPFTEQTFLELQRRLYAMDLFEQIIPNAVRPGDLPDGPDDGMVLSFEVQERPVITAIQFSGNNRLGRNRLRDVILLKQGDMVTRSKLRMDEEAIRNLYLEQGFPNISVSSEFIQEEEENIVRFTINEGAQLSIESIRFAGNQFASEANLRGVMQLRERSIFNRGLFQATLLEQDKNRIRRFYYERGYIDADVVDVRKDVREEPDENRSYLTLTLSVDEGAQYTFGGITFQGNTIFSDDELGGLVRLEAGDVLDLVRFEADYQRVADRYYESGYIFNQITRREIRDEETRTISFQVDIVERNRAHIENIIFRGNEKTKDFVLAREIPLEVGDVFSATRIREGLRNLANLQYFSAIAPETPPGSTEGLMDLIINLEEGSTADITFGLAFGGNQDFPVSAQIQWQDRNFRGRGQIFGIQATASPVNQRVTFNFRERWLFGRRWSGGLNLSFDRSVINNVPQNARAPLYADGDDNAVPDPYNHEDYVFTKDGTEFNGRTYNAGDRFPGTPSSTAVGKYNLENEYEYLGGSTRNIPSENLMSYDAYNIRLGANTGYTFRTPLGRFTPRTSISTGIRYLTYDDSIYRPASDTTRDNHERWRFINTWGLGAALDRRDFIYSPSSGFRLDQQFNLTGGFLGGERHFTRSETTAEVFFTLWDVPLGEWNWKMVLGMQSKLSFILPNFLYSEDSDKYFKIEQSDTLRLDGMFTSRGWSFRSDGATTWNNWIELRMPLSEQVIWWDTFFEAAVMREFSSNLANWDDRQRMSDIEKQDWQFTIGTGIRFVIPQFPIRLYLAKRFEYDENGNIEWKTGNLFNGGDSDSGRGVDLVFTIGAEFF
ncbi:outer membrane protein assembly factor BamA [Alkalispirochaeta alkalica]|uniref:outer membrane protein assembly factor BamA n=1 Tax=Alkalispirochaeta alkalica TaxID=46356 RepID=UPI0004774CEF|nr:outer membrane protein assembly factor BamA [Alkalispirochaeta alkalica]